MSVASMIAKAGTTLSLRKVAKARRKDGTIDEQPVAYRKGIPTWLQPATAEIVAQYAARDMRVSYTAYMETDPEVHNDEATIVVNGIAYAVRGVRDQAGLNRCWALDVG